jgi:HEAT repeat protein
MTSLTRWRLLSGLLVAMLAHTWWPEGAQSARVKRPAKPGMPLRISAAAAGISLDDLIGKLLAARSVEEIRELAETLATVGDDHAIDALTPLLTDPRTGVSEAMVSAFGRIATEHAVDVIAPFTRDARYDMRVGAIEALGATHQATAEAPLISIAQDASLDTQMRTSAIYALGTLGSDGSIAVLEQIAATGAQDLMPNATMALSRIDSPPAREAISRLIDSPSIEVARSALGAITVVDDELFTKLSDLIAGDDHTLTGNAVDAIAHAGGRALPILKQVAIEGPNDARGTAIAALATIDSPESVDTLRSLLEEDDADVVAAVLTALSGLQTDEARDLLISAGLSENDETAQRAVDFLITRSGPEVDAALVEVVKLHKDLRMTVLRHLVASGHAQGKALALEMAHSSDDDERLLGIRIFAEAGTADSLTIALELVRNEHGAIKLDALSLLDATQSGEPAVFELLRDTVRTGTPDEIKVALRVLSRNSSTDARDVIIGALNNSDIEIVSTAIGALEKFRMTPEITNALRSVADSHSELRVAVMQQLFNAGSPVAIDIAEKLIHSENSYDVESTFRALEQANTPLAADLLVRVAGDRDPATRASALRAMTYLKDKRTVEVAMRSLRDQDQTVRQAATNVLANARTDAAKSALLDFTRSADPNDRLAAVNALRGVTDDRTLTRMKELAHDANYSVAYNALEMFVDYTNNMAALRELLFSDSLNIDLRLRAGGVLRDRGRADPTADALLEQLEGERYGYDDD